MNNEIQENTRPDLKFNDTNNILLIDGSLFICTRLNILSLIQNIYKTVI